MNIPFLGEVAVDFWEMAASYAGIASLLLGGVLVVVVGFVTYYKYQKGDWFAKFPVKARIWEIRAGHPLLIDMDKARSRKDEKGAWFYELKNRKTITKAVPFDYINPDSSVDLLALSRDEYHPIQLIAEKATVLKAGGGSEEQLIPKLKPIISEDFGIAYAYRTHKNYERKPVEDFWTKFGGIVTILVTGIMVMLILVVVLDRMTFITGNLSSTAAAFADAATKLAACGAQVPAHPAAP